MRIAALLVLTLLLAGCAVGGSTKTTTVTRTVTVARPASTTPGPEDATYFGRPVSVTRVDARRYLLVLKPEFYLVGVTANVVAAAQQQIACAPFSCPGALDDRVVVPAGSQELTFVLPARASGTVLTVHDQQTENTTVSAAQLAAIVGGAKTPKLIEPLDSGVWLSVRVDTVQSFAQQFQP